METLVAYAIVLFFGIGLHEYAHAKLADMAGDPTPGMFGRVTLNLTKHFELFGTIMMVVTMIAGVGIGWGKPVPMDPRKMRNPKWDHFIAVIGGPITNLLQAGLYAIVFRVLAMSAPAALSGGFLPILLEVGIITNIALFLFNLIPLGPLDGMWLFGTFLPEPTKSRWTRWNLTMGSMVFLGLILMGQLSGLNIISRIILPPLVAIYRFMTGVPF